MLDVFCGRAPLTLVTGLSFVDLAVVGVDAVFSSSAAMVVDPVIRYINK
jgi:hypothetical protein